MRGELKHVMQALNRGGLDGSALVTNAAETLMQLQTSSCVVLIGLLIAGIPSARATLFTYQANLNGISESPANASPATGFTEVDYDSVAHTLRVQTSFSGLTGSTTASHIHAPTVVPGTGTAGVATQVPSFANFPLGVTAGNMDQTLDLTLASSYNPSYITANGGTPATAEAAFISAISSDQAYLNIHTNTFGGGEIRGFLVLVPEPGLLAVLLTSATLVLRRRCRA